MGPALAGLPVSEKIGPLRVLHVSDFGSALGPATSLVTALGHIYFSPSSACV